jgi:hypothetical protein
MRRNGSLCVVTGASAGVSDFKADYDESLSKSQVNYLLEVASEPDRGDCGDRRF